LQEVDFHSNEELMKTLLTLFIGLFFTATAAYGQEGLQEVEYDSDGRFAVQIEAWRSEVKADYRVSLWKERGFEHARYVEYGNETNGDIWFRVHLGRFSSISDAKSFQNIFTGMYEHDTWITTTNGKSEKSSISSTSSPN